MSAGRASLARAVSIGGHPLLVMPVAALLAARSRGADAATVHMLLVLVGGLGAAVFAYTLIQVRRGRWLHVDASRRRERRQLNLVLLAAFAAAAAWTLYRGAPSPLVAAFVAAAAIIAVALLLAPWLKLSLHVAFTLFAAFLPLGLGTGMALAAVAVAVAWSRLVLQRHSHGEVLVGALVGALAGLVFRMS